MPRTADLSATKAILAALHFAAASDIPRLKVLVSSYPSVFNTATLLRVLLCLPETADTSAYTPLLNTILSGATISNDDSSKQLDTASVAALSEKSARRKVERFLPPLNTETEATHAETPEELVAAFLLARAERIDTETGALSISESLLLEFAPVLPAVEDFYTGTVKVLSKLVYTFSRDAPGLSDFRGLPLDDAIAILLADRDSIVRDLDELVVPYLSVRAPDSWDAVWRRLSTLPFPALVETVTKWNPPEEVKTDFAAMAIGTCYRTTEAGREVWDGMHAIQRRISATVERRISALMKSASGATPVTELGDLTNMRNRLFVPNTATLKLLDLMITSAAILGRPLAETLRIRLEGIKEVQQAVLGQYVRGVAKNDDDEWRKTRDAARWLRAKSEVLGKLSLEEVEKTVLAGMLSATRFSLVREFYVNKHGGLPKEAVERAVLEAFGEFYDNATNGNKTRGHMKNALQAIQVLYPHASISQPLEAASRLISATHALSNYSLTLVPGQPLLPVQIRIHPDPVSLISRLLDSNRKSYLQPDALVSIAKDLVVGTTNPAISPAPSLDAVEARVIGMATEAALGEEDFETAYAYVTARLLPSASSSEVLEVLWRTAYAAGRWRSPYAALANAPPRGPVALALLEKKMELLSLALQHCPKEALADVLTSWRRCEEEVETLLEAEARAEEEHAALLSGTGKPRTAAAAAPEGPQSLFDVAKGAANVFGARGIVGLGRGRGEGGSEEGEEGRTRKRDVVSGMVTHGLASGIGWVLGAKPNLPEQQ